MIAAGEGCPGLADSRGSFAISTLHGRRPIVISPLWRKPIWPLPRWQRASGFFSSAPAIDVTPLESRRSQRIGLAALVGALDSLGIARLVPWVVGIERQA